MEYYDQEQVKKIVNILLSYTSQDICVDELNIREVSNNSLYVDFELIYTYNKNTMVLYQNEHKIIHGKIILDQSTCLWFDIFPLIETHIVVDYKEIYGENFTRIDIDILQEALEHNDMYHIL